MNTNELGAVIGYSAVLLAGLTFAVVGLRGLHHGWREFHPKDKGQP